jgi:hypothetical protein
MENNKGKLRKVPGAGYLILLTKSNLFRRIPSRQLRQNENTWLTSGRNIKTRLSRLRERRRCFIFSVSSVLDPCNKTL